MIGNSSDFFFFLYVIYSVVTKNILWYTCTMSLLTSAFIRLRCTWHNHLSTFLRFFFWMDTTFHHLVTYWRWLLVLVLWMHSILIMSFLVMPLIHFDIFISVKTHFMFGLFLDCSPLSTTSCGSFYSHLIKSSSILRECIGHTASKHFSSSHCPC